MTKALAVGRCRRRLLALSAWLVVAREPRGRSATASCPDEPVNRKLVMSKKQSKATRQANAQRAAERAAATRREQERKERRRRTIVVSAVVLSVLAVVVVIVVAVQSSRDSVGGGAGQTAGEPSGVVDSYAVASGEASAPVKVEVYEDFLCPACGDFEDAAGPTLERYAASKDVQVRYLPISFLDPLSNDTEYSTRAVNAVGVVLDEAGPAAALELHDLLFDNQPAEGSDGLSDGQLVELATRAGADEAAVAGPIEALRFEQWVSEATKAAQDEGVGGTPTVLVNGDKLDDNSVESLTAAVEAARP